MEHTTCQQPVIENQATIKDRYDEIQSLSEEAALLIIGAPASGKTEKLCWLMASHCHQGHWVWLIDPFAPASRYKGLRVFGRNLNYSEAALGLREFIFEVNKRIHLKNTDPNYNSFHELHIHLAIDEISNISYQISQHDETIMLEFWRIDFQSLKSTNMSVSIASHEDIYNLMPGEETFHNDLTRLYCKAIKDPIAKHRKCAGWAEKVAVSTGARSLVTKIDIPDWMIAPPDYNYEAIAFPYKA